MRYIHNANVNFALNGLTLPITLGAFYAASELANPNKEIIATGTSLVVFAAIFNATSAAFTRFSSDLTDISRKRLIENLALVGSAFLVGTMWMLSNEAVVSAHKENPASAITASAMLSFFAHVAMNLMLQVTGDTNAVRKLIADVLGIIGLVLFFITTGMDLHALNSLPNNSNNKNMRTADDMKLFVTSLFTPIILNSMRQNTIVQSAASNVVAATKKAGTGIASLWKAYCEKKDPEAESLNGGPSATMPREETL